MPERAGRRAEPTAHEDRAAASLLGLPAQHPIPQVSSRDFSTSVGRSPRILLVEDHTDSREALSALLEAVGYRVQTASNGREAVQQALADPPDLILMDVMMPVMDGLDATRRLRAAEEFPDIPIIAVTAMEGAGELAAEAGCSGTIPKPIPVPELLRRIRTWTEHRWSPRTEC